MSLRERRALAVDVQTTGMRPTSGRLLEAAWVEAGPLDGVEGSSLVALPDGESLPNRIAMLTGISAADLQAGARPSGDVKAALESAIAALGESPLVIAHYASFERPWLEDLWGTPGEPLPFRLLCTHQLATRLHPELPSRNIRAVAGFFGHQAPGGLKRALEHARATVGIWRGLVEDLERLGLTDLEAVEAWMRERPRSKAVRYEYRVDRLKRLDLPRAPGVYRMISKAGDVLYVGKATCLKDRVNSYFRGKKGREPRKLEMIAQAWDLQITECATPLEAALLEGDEIKRLDPPYNVSLKTGSRRLVFYSRDFSSESEAQDSDHPRGPFRPQGPVEQLRLLAAGRATDSFEGVFYEPLPLELLREGYALFLESLSRKGGEPRSMRDLLALAVDLERKHRRETDSIPEEASDEGNLEEVGLIDETASSEDVLPTAPEIAAKFGRMFVRVGAELRRSRRLTRLLNAKVSWGDSTDVHTLVFRRGRCCGEEDGARPHFPWKDLGIADYDRMSILLSGISRGPHRIEPLTKGDNWSLSDRIC